MMTPPSDDEITKSFMNFCRGRKDILIAQYPNSAPLEIIRILADEFNSLDLLPPPLEQSFSPTREIFFNFRTPN